MRRHNIPTAQYETVNSTAEAIGFLRSGKFGDENSSVVVKADGLAAGKGVIVTGNRYEAEQAVYELEKLVGKEAVEKIVLEEFLAGREVSLIMFADGENFALMPAVRDHKRIGENDTGANTGGMGTISDSNLLSQKDTEKVVEEIIKPTLKGAKAENFPVRGILFLGLMMTETGAKLLEYNVRFGDPETQVILARLETDLVEICEAIISQKIDSINIEWLEGNSACIILASKGYPQKPQIGDVIYGLNKLKNRKDIQVFHAGTARNRNADFITAGGRVLGVTATAEDLNKALQKAYQAVDEISFDGMQYRKDIGK
jgi:phosphoribosylamine--glycine ligase